MSSPFVELPLASLAVWSGVAAWGWLKGLRTAPERAFTAGNVLVGAWAFADWLVYHIPESGDASLILLVVHVRMTLLVFTSLAFFYFGRWLVRPRGLVDGVALIPAAAAVGIVWTMAVRGVQYADGIPWIVREPVGYIAVQRRATFARGGTKRRLSAILWVLVIGLTMWGAGNVYGALSPGPTSPVVTLFPLLLGVLLLGAVVRIDPSRFRSAMRKLLVTPARPMMAILYHNSGSPLAEVILPGGKALDPADLSNLMQAVDHVLTTALKSDPGALRQLRHGDFYVLFERGANVTLVAVLEGPPSEGLRSEMRRAVRDFESIHDADLRTWETAAGLADQALSTLDELLVPSVL